MTSERFPLNSDLSLAYRMREATSAQEPSLLLLLHGVGSNEFDLLALEPYLSGRLHVISARAPYPYGPGFAWFSLQFEPVPGHDAEEAEASRVRLLNFIRELSDRLGVPHQRIYLMGFSQGAIMSLSVALSDPGLIAGVVAMSGRVPQEVSANVEVKPEHRKLPILLTHGLNDETLPIHHGRTAREVLERLPVDLEYREYQMGHEVSEESLRDILAWLERRLDNGK